MKRVAIFGLRRQSLDREDRCTVRLHGEEQTRTDGLAVKQYSAAAADSLFAAEVSPGKPEMVAQEISQRQTRLDESLVLFAVDVDLDGVPCRHVLCYRHWFLLEFLPHLM